MGSERVIYLSVGVAGEGVTESVGVGVDGLLRLGKQCTCVCVYGKVWKVSTCMSLCVGVSVGKCKCVRGAGKVSMCCLDVWMGVVAGVSMGVRGERCGCGKCGRNLSVEGVRES